MAAEAQPLAIFGRVLIDRVVVDDAVVVVAGAKIQHVGHRDEVATASHAVRLDIPDRLISPGFIDLHIHGSAGCDAADDPIGVARHVVSGGCTYFLPTLMTNELSSMVDSLVRIREVTGPVGNGATIGGAHLEGPFLNSDYGAQERNFVLEPSPEVVDVLLEAAGTALAMVTIAPEQPGAIEAIKRFVAVGALVSLGHSNATSADYVAARHAGAAHVTHLFNAMEPKRADGTAEYKGVRPVGLEEFALIDDDLTADIVCDSASAHVHETLVRLALRCKGSTRLSLITDAMFTAGLQPGVHRMSDGNDMVTRSGEDVARLTGGSLCGSVMSMANAVKNLTAVASVPLDVALVMATEAPARALGIFDHRGSLAQGKEADITILDPNGRVEHTFVRGQLVYSVAPGALR